MAVVYSTRLFGTGALPIGSYNLGGPDAAHKWIVKHMVAMQVGGPNVAHAGYLVVDNLGYLLWGINAPWARSAISYEWEGTQVLEALQTVTFHVLDDGWQLRGSGYLLVLP